MLSGEFASRIENDGERSGAENEDSNQQTPDIDSKLPCLGKLKEELTCSICLDVCVRPCTTPCGHNFCRKCLRGALQYNSKCPKCREMLPSSFSLNVNTVLWNTIQLLFPTVSQAPPSPPPVSPHSHRQNINLVSSSDDIALEEALRPPRGRSRDADGYEPLDVLLSRLELSDPYGQWQMVGGNGEGARTVGSLGSESPPPRTTEHLPTLPLPPPPRVRQYMDAPEEPRLELLAARQLRNWESARSRPRHVPRTRGSAANSPESLAARLVARQAQSLARFAEQQSRVGSSSRGQPEPRRRTLGSSPPMEHVPLSMLVSQSGEARTRTPLSVTPRQADSPRNADWAIGDLLGESPEHTPHSPPPAPHDHDRLYPDRLGLHYISPSFRSYSPHPYDEAGEALDDERALEEEEWLELAEEEEAELYGTPTGERFFPLDRESVHGRYDLSEIQLIEGIDGPRIVPRRNRTESGSSTQSGEQTRRSSAFRDLSPHSERDAIGLFMRNDVDHDHDRHRHHLHDHDHDHIHHHHHNDHHNDHHDHHHHHHLDHEHEHDHHYDHDHEHDHVDHDADVLYDRVMSRERQYRTLLSELQRLPRGGSSSVNDNGDASGSGPLGPDFRRPASDPHDLVVPRMHYMGGESDLNDDSSIDQDTSISPSAARIPNRGEPGASSPVRLSRYGRPRTDQPQLPSLSLGRQRQEAFDRLYDISHQIEAAVNDIEQLAMQRSEVREPATPPPGASSHPMQMQMAGEFVDESEEGDIDDVALPPRVGQVDVVEVVPETPDSYAGYEQDDGNLLLDIRLHRALMNQELEVMNSPEREVTVSASGSSRDEYYDCSADVGPAVGIDEEAQSAFEILNGTYGDSMAGASGTQGCNAGNSAGVVVGGGTEEEEEAGASNMLRLPHTINQLVSNFRRQRAASKRSQGVVRT